MSANGSPSSYWCYRCGRFTAVPSHRQDSYSSLFCPNCNSGFIEHIDSPARLPKSTLSDSRRSPTSDCIVPWLNLLNSCLVCRHELPSENQDAGYLNTDAVGLTV
ncbi:putative E3 ubiquitin-protein ligase RNF126-like, zinc-ribbon [Helianthus anomalus]